MATLILDVDLPSIRASSTTQQHPVQLYENSTREI